MRGEKEPVVGGNGHRRRNGDEQPLQGHHSTNCDTRQPLLVARQLAELGIGVLPLNEDIAPLTKHGAYEATTDPGTIERWARSYPGANWGASVADLIVIDADSPQHARDGKGPDGVAHWHQFGIGGYEPADSTPSQGLHSWWARPKHVKIKTSASLIAPAIDVISGYGRYVPLAGCITPRGNYTAIRSLSVGLLYAPESLLRVIRASYGKPARVAPRAPNERVTVESTLTRLRRAQVGNRNNELNLAAYLLGRLVAQGMARYGDVQALLVDAGLVLGLEPNEVHHTVASGLNAGARVKGALPVLAHQKYAYEVMQWTLGHVWERRTGNTDRRAALAHEMIALKAGHDVYAADVRTLAELANVGCIETARMATLRLIAQQVIALVCPGSRFGFRPSEYRLCVDLPEKRQKQTYTKDSRIDVLPAEEADEHEETRAGAQPGFGVCPLLTDFHDVWRRKGLGSVAGQVYGVLRQVNAPLSVIELHERTGRSERSIQRALKSMLRVVDEATGEVASLVTKTGTRYRATDADLDHIARLLHVDGEGLRQHERHERERYEHSLSWQIERARRREQTLPSPSGTAKDRADTARSHRLIDAIRDRKQPEHEIVVPVCVPDMAIQTALFMSTVGHEALDC